MKMDYTLKDILPRKENIAERLNTLLSREKYARVLLYIALKFQDVAKVVHVKEIEENFRIPKVTAFKILDDFAYLGVIRRKKLEGVKVVEYVPEFNDKEMVILKYVNRAKMTLGVK